MYWFINARVQSSHILLYFQWAPTWRISGKSSISLLKPPLESIPLPHTYRPLLHLNLSLRIWRLIQFPREMRLILYYRSVFCTHWKSLLKLALHHATKACPSCKDTLIPKPKSVPCSNVQLYSQTTTICQDSWILRQLSSATFLFSKTAFLCHRATATIPT